MIDQLRSIGIEKGKPFAPDAATKQALADGIREAQRGWRRNTTPACRRSSRAHTGRSRLIPNCVKAAARTSQSRTTIRSMRAVSTYTYAYIGIKRLGAGQFYLINIRDKDGESYDGGKTYRLHVPPNAPVEQYWSVTVYDRETHALIKNVDRASRASQQRRSEEERRRIGRSLFRPEGAGRQGIQLDSDRSRRASSS